MPKQCGNHFFNSQWPLELWSRPKLGWEKGRGRCDSRWSPNLGHLAGWPFSHNWAICEDFCQVDATVLFFILS